MDLSVIAVGDGACSVAFADWHGIDLVMDCGAGTNPMAQAPAAQLLIADLVKRNRVPVLPSRMLVTHFDADHWGGLAQMPLQAGHPLFRLKVPKEVTFFYPRFPQIATPISVAMVANALIVTAMQNAPFFELVDAWKKAGAKVSARPLSRGDQFCGPDGDWDVHWPPLSVEELSKAARRDVEHVVQGLQRLVLSSHVVRLAYAAARTSLLFAEMQEETNLEGIAETLDEVAEYPLGTLELQGRIRELARVEEDQAEDSYLDGLLWARLRKYNNALSLVVSNYEQSFVNFGDCEKVGLNGLLKLNSKASSGPFLPTEPRIILAPHHGTQKPGVSLQTSFPDAERIILQNGHQHSAKNRSKRAFYASKAKQCVLETHDPSIPGNKKSYFMTNL